MRLQKVMFFVVADATLNKMYLKTLKPYFEKECFEVWDYGPVLRSVYIHHRYHSSNTYQEYSERLSFLDSYILKYAEFEPFELVEWTRALPIWVNNKEKILERKTNQVYTWNHYLKESHKLVEKRIYLL